MRLLTDLRLLLGIKPILFEVMDSHGKIIASTIGSLAHVTKNCIQQHLRIEARPVLIYLECQEDYFKKQKAIPKIHGIDSTIVTKIDSLLIAGRTFVGTNSRF